MATPSREDLERLRRLAELKAKAAGGAMPVQQPSGRMDMSNVSRPDGSQYDPYNPTVGMSGAQRFLAGAGKALTDIYRGGAQLLGADNQAEIDAAKARDLPLMQTGAGMAGNIAGNVAAFLPTSMIPGANTYTGAALIGAGIGALQPTAEGDSRLTNVAAGAAGGAAGQGLANALSRVLAPKTAPAVRQLLDEGVTPTPGQTLGGVYGKLESALESVPFLGEGIRKAKGRAVEQYNVAALNRVLRPIGQSVKNAGYEGLEQARSLTSRAYDDAFDVLKRVDIDPQFQGAMANINQMLTSVPKTVQRQFARVIDDSLNTKITPANTMAARTAKSAYSDLSKKAQLYLRSQNPDQVQLGEALRAVADEVKGLAARNNPMAGNMLKKADEAYTMLLRVENAAARQGADEGVFSPAMLAAAARQMDSSGRKLATTQGRAPMQRFATAGKQVLGDTLPNSGTVDRAMASGLLFGAGTAINPLLIPGLWASSGLYSRPAQSAIVAALAKRPEMIRQLGGQVGRLAAPVGVGGSALAVQQ